MNSGGLIADKDVVLYEDFSKDIGGSQLKSLLVTDQWSHTRHEKGETGSGGAFASKRLFHDDVISRRGFFCSADTFLNR